MASLIELESQLGAGSSGSLNISALTQKIRSKPELLFVAESLDLVGRSVSRIEKALKAAPGTKRIQIDSADILDLIVGGEDGPGQLTILSGPPSYTRIGWDGTDDSGDAKTVSSAVNGTFTTSTAHGLGEGDIVHIEANTSLVHNGYWVVDSVTTPTVFAVADPPVGSGTGGTSTLQFAGGWRKSFAIGGTGFSDAPFFADSMGKVIIGKNGSVLIQDQFKENKGFLGVVTDSPKTVSGVANNGSGLVRLTVVAHGWEDGDSLQVAGASYPIQVVDADTVDLLDSVFGSFPGASTATRYFAGGWGEAWAAGGTGFADAPFRVKASGQVFIDDAVIIINGQGEDTLGNPIDYTLTLSPEVFTLVNETDEKSLTLHSGRVYLGDLNDVGHYAFLDLDDFQIANGAVAIAMAVAGGSANAFFTNNSGIATILLQSFDGSIDGRIFRSSGVQFMDASRNASLNTLALVTDLPVTEGGTGASTASAALANLGGTTLAAVQAWIASQGFLTQADADLLYAALGHDHAGVYSPVGHSHSITITSTTGTVPHTHTGTAS